MSCPSRGGSLTSPINRTSTDTPHLIVGAGLAGCLLAWRFQQADEPFILIGSSQLSNAFGVAAGVINPVTGRWMTKTWNFDQLLPEAQSTYRSLETTLGIKVYHPIREIRFCQNSEDVKRVGRRMRNPRYADVLNTFSESGQAAPAFDDPYGSFEIRQAAYVQLPELVTTLRQHFSEAGKFRDEIFDYSALRRANNNWRYQSTAVRDVIFCEGAAARHNPWFTQLALQPAKGETLLCQSSTLKLPRTLYHHKKWLLPYPDGSFRVGATYDEQDLSETPTVQRRHELLSALKDSLREGHDVQVLKHLAGVRPSSRDNRPLLGRHPCEAGLYILNGLGSKGASTAPAMARELAEHLLNGAPLSSEVALSRFDSTPCV